MKRIGVLYATRDGHTLQIAEHIAVMLQSPGIEPEIRSLRNPDTDINLSGFDAVILASPVRAGKHLPEAVRFIRQHRAQLETMPAAFLSISLSQAGVERPGTTQQERAPFAADVQDVIRRFIDETGWRPTAVQAVAGALMYRKYNFLIRFLLKRIARNAGASTDTSRNHEFTDWAALDRFIGWFLAQLAAPVQAKSA